MKKSIFVSFFIMIFCYSNAQQSGDSIAVRKVLEKDAVAWRAADAKGQAACWFIRPYSRILVSLADGTIIDIPPAKMMDTTAHKMGNGGAAVMSNYKQNISGNNAWVSHNEESTDKDGNKTYSYEIRLLEKINNEWKLVGQSIHLYHPK